MQIGEIRSRIVAALTRVLAQALPPSVARQVAAELKITMKRSLYSHSSRHRLAKMQGCRVNIGCGSRATLGWVNLDLFAGPNVYFWDCRRGLPFREGAVTAIYSEHMLEHFDPETEAKLFLRECWRCLKLGGILRIVVPDAGAYVRAYGRGWELLAPMRPLLCDQDGWKDRWLGDVYRTQMQFLNAVFRQGSEHKYAYDEETLALNLSEAGFSRVIPQRFGISIDADMASDSEDRRTESLYVEAVK